MAKSKQYEDYGLGAYKKVPDSTNTGEPPEPVRVEQPKNLIEALAAMDKLLPIEDKEAFMESSEDEAIGLSHHSTGRWLRNNWGLWDENSDLHKWFVKHGIHHADDMSGIIITTYYRTLNFLPIDLPGQIQHYKDYWAKQEADEAGDDN